MVLPSCPATPHPPESSSPGFCSLSLLGKHLQYLNLPSSRKLPTLIAWLPCSPQGGDLMGKRLSRLVHRARAQDSAQHMPTLSKYFLNE